MKFLRFVMFLFYNYYKSGRWESTPHFHMLTSVSFFIFLHILLILRFTNFLPGLFNENYFSPIWKIMIVITLIACILNFLGPYKIISKMHMSGAQIKSGNKYLILYIVLLFVGIILSFTFS